MPPVVLQSLPREKLAFFREAWIADFSSMEKRASGSAVRPPRLGFFFSWNVKRHRGLVWRQGAIHNSTERFLAADGFDDVIDTTHNEAEVWADSQTAANAVAGAPKL